MSSQLLIEMNVNKVIGSGLELILFKKTNLSMSKVLSKVKNNTNIKMRFLISEAKITFSQLK